MIIDSHVHMMADSIAPRALEKLEKSSGAKAFTDLTEASTRRFLEKNGIDFGVIAPIATRPTQVDTINDWAASVNHGNILSFGTLYPGMEDPEAEVQKIVDRGLHGVKLHPDYQSFYADDPAMYPVYQAISDAGLPVLFHAGRDVAFKNVTHCTPAMLRRISEIFPQLCIIGAHLGGNAMYDAVERDLVGTNVYLDISLAQYWATPEQIARIVADHGTERILFATDMPWTDPQEGLKLVDWLPIAKYGKEHILWKNAARIIRSSRLPDADEPQL